MSFILSFLLFPSLLFGVDISVGISTWYSSHNKTILAGNGKPEKKYTIEPRLLYGPVLGLTFSEDWSFTSVFLYNTSPYIQKNPDGTESKFKRLDSDNLLNYNINRFLKIFIGIKSQYIAIHSTPEGTIWDIGPGAGIGTSIPVAGNLYVLANVSGMYTWGHKHTEGGVIPPSQDTSIKRYGYNLVGNLAYYITQMSLTASIGYRYQFYRTDLRDSSINDYDSQFYGFIFSLVYIF